MSNSAVESLPSVDFQRRFFNGGELVRGIVTLHALAVDMPRMFPPHVIVKLSYRHYRLPLKHRHLENNVLWLLEHMEAPEREWVLKQPFAAKIAQKAGDALRL